MEISGNSTLFKPNYKQTVIPLLLLFHILHLISSLEHGTVIPNWLNRRDFFYSDSSCALRLTGSVDTKWIVFLLNLSLEAFPPRQQARLQRFFCQHLFCNIYDLIDFMGMYHTPPQHTALTETIYKYNRQYWYVKERLRLVSWVRQ